LALSVLYSWATASFAWLSQRKRLSAWSLAGMWTVNVAYGLMPLNWPAGFSAEIHTATSIVIIASGIAAGPILLLRAAGWALARMRRPGGGPDGAQYALSSSAALSRRQIVEGTAGVVVLGASSTVLGWGAVRGRHMVELCEVPIAIHGLPRALDGYAIAQISDLHAGLHLAEHDFDTALDLVRKTRADLIVVTGDMVDVDPLFAPYVARKLSELRARDGVAAILGNHDYYAGARRVTEVLRAGGVEVLVNEGRLLRGGDGGGFALLGVDDRQSARYGAAGPRLDRALEMVPVDVPRILLSHQPPTVDKWAGQVALQLSGHTHGGQINPGFRPADLFLPYVAGLYTVGGTTLYVNRGLGTVGPPSRVGAPPEVTRIVLVAT
jgi:uncharacterized protein